MLEAIKSFINADTGKSHKIKSVFLPGLSSVISVCNRPTALTATRRDVKLVSFPGDTFNDGGCIDGGDQPLLRTDIRVFRDLLRNIVRAQEYRAF